MRPFAKSALDFEEIRADVKSYAKFGPMDDEIPAYRMEETSSLQATSPPKCLNQSPYSSNSRP
jgi:hypothetical protein